MFMAYICVLLLLCAVLDLGCGPGNLIPYLADEFPEARIVGEKLPMPNNFEITT